MSVSKGDLDVSIASSAILGDGLTGSIDKNSTGGRGHRFGFGVVGSVIDHDALAEGIDEAIAIQQDNRAAREIIDEFIAVDSPLDRCSFETPYAPYVPSARNT